MRTITTLPPVIAVTGLAFEARIAAGEGVRVICAGDQEYLRQQLREALAAECSGIISFGLAGGLDPALESGSWIVAETIIDDSTRFTTHRRWTSMLLQRLPGATPAEIAGSNSPLADPQAKSALRQSSGAAAVDMESHIAARLAAEWGVPFAASRVIIDPAGRTLPAAAIAARRSDGTIDVIGLCATVLRGPGQVPALLRLAIDARMARVSLARGRHLLGTGLGFPDFVLL